MTSRTYQVDTPRWLWQLWTRAIDDCTDYEKYNDRIVEAIAVDVRRFDAAGLLDLDDSEHRRIELVISEVTVDDDVVPPLIDEDHVEASRDHTSSNGNHRGESSR
jgi:hypothetical protein